MGTVTSLEDRDASVREAARAALVEQVGADAVGNHLSTTDEGDGVHTERFECQLRGYPGWCWAVTVVRLDAAQAATVNEVVLLPGDDAIVAPRWVPWRERIRPGDLSPGDVLPAEEDDARLVPAYLTGDPGDDFPEREDAAVYRATADELGLGRRRVLSIEGRDAAAERWYDGSQGPDAPLAQSAPARCASCGFLVLLSGALGTRFGLCANEYANDDGRVVSLDHGCGAHSETQLRRKHLPAPLPDPVVDDLEPDLEPF